MPPLGGHDLSTDTILILAFLFNSSSFYTSSSISSSISLSLLLFLGLLVISSVGTPVYLYQAILSYQNNRGTEMIAMNKNNLIFYCMGKRRTPLSINFYFRAFSRQSPFLHICLRGP